ncbi:MAG TPA: hypothetical protein VGU45_11890 [Microvirga sp.]|jgi:hypothetical protein|nr:hypothetical protein [Microvirga sp.]
MASAETTAEFDLKGEKLRAAVMAKLVERGVVEVRIEFDGCGDEGQVDEIVAVRTDGVTDLLDWPCEIPGKMMGVGRVWDPKHRTMVLLDAPRPMTMYDLLDAWAFDLLEETGVDWVNNEGGFGEIVIDPVEDSISCEMNQRYVTHQTSEHEL